MTLRQKSPSVVLATGGLFRTTALGVLYGARRPHGAWRSLRRSAPSTAL